MEESWKILKLPSQTFVKRPSASLRDRCLIEEKTAAYLQDSAVLAALVVRNYEEDGQRECTGWNHISTVHFFWSELKLLLMQHLKPVMYAVYPSYLPFSWLLIAFLFRALPHNEMQSSPLLHDTALMSSCSHFLMISCDVKQRYKTESFIRPHRVSSRTVFNGPSSLYKHWGGRSLKVGSAAITFCQLLVVRWRNVTPPLWLMDSADLNGAFVFIFGHDGPEPVITDLDSWGLMPSSEWTFENKTKPGVNQKWGVWIFLFSEQQTKDQQLLPYC